MTTTDVIMIVAVVAIFTGLVVLGVRRRRGARVERKPPPRRDLD